MASSGTSSGGSSGVASAAWGQSAPPQSAPPAYAPPPTAGGNKPAGNSLQNGSFGIDVTSPEGLAASMGANVQQGGNFLEGLGNALFGTKNEGGVPLISDAAHLIGRGADEVGKVPLVGGAVGAAGNVIGGVGALVGHGADIVGGALEHVDLGPNSDHQELQRRFDALPDSPEKKAAQDQIKNDPLATGHYMTAAVKADLPNQQIAHPDLYPELHVPTTNIADSLSQLFGLLTVPVKLAERGTAGTQKISTGLDRLQEIEAVHDGAVYTGTLGSGAFSGGQNGKGTSGNTQAEEIAYTKWKDGSWTPNQALDFLTASGQGFSHDAGLEIAGSVAFDPLTWGSLGAAGLSKLGATAVEVARVSKIAEAAGEAAPLIKDAGAAVRKADVLGKLAKSPQVNGIVRSLGEHVYTPMESNILGQAAKVARTIIDPLHAMGQGHTVGEATVDIAADSGGRIMGQAHGQLAMAQLGQDMHDLGLVDQHLEDIGTYSSNLIREVLMGYHVGTTLVSGVAKSLIGKNPGEIVDFLTHNAPKDYADLIRERMVQVREMAWDGPARVNLGERMASMYGTKSAGEWVDFLANKSTDYLSTLHATTYGRATTNFLNAVGRGVTELGAEGARALKLDRMILLNKTTLTELGAKGILENIKGASDTAEAASLIRVQQELYPALRYVRLDPKDLERTVSQFEKWLGGRVEDGVLPAQLTNDEIARLPQHLQDFHAQARGAWSIGIRPEDDKLMGLVYDAEGKLTAGFDPWVDHVAMSSPAYRGTFALEHNVAGMPILGRPVGKMMDYMQAGAQTFSSRVSSASISHAAKTRFAVHAAERFPGMTVTEAHGIFDAVTEAAGIHKITPRGLSAQNMWEKAAVMVPDRLATTGEMMPRDLMQLVVKAYEGDLRFVGLTQKFTGRVKSWLADKTGSNFAGQFSEDLYQRIRFKYNPLFQTQERIEPWVLNGQRGVNFALGNKMTEVDRQAAQLYERMRDTGLMRASDVEQAEYNAMALAGGNMEETLTRFADKSLWGRLTDVKGVKRVNELRTFQNNMGKAMRSAMDRDVPGTWQKIVDNYSVASGHLISDDEAAIRYLSENGLAHDLINKPGVLTKPGDGYTVFRDLISQQEWHAPSSIGELKALDLDVMSKSMGVTLKDGSTINGVADMRAALADRGSGVNMDRLKSLLRTHGAHDDYIRRVENALNFHYDGFWKTAKSTYGLTGGEMTRLQGLYAGAAELRGMTPVDYLSQVFSPMIRSGESATIGDMATAVSILRSPVGGGTPEMLLGQMADVFRSHLDPSMQDTLISAFAKDAKPLGAVDRAAVKAEYAPATVEGYAHGGRFVSQKEYDAISAEGAALRQRIEAAPSSPSQWLDQPTGADIQAAYDAGDVAKGQSLNKDVGIARGGTAESGGAMKPNATPAQSSYEGVRSAAFKEVQDPWGGATFDSHTGELLKSKAVYHGQPSPTRAENIVKTGMQDGDLVNNVKLAKSYAGEKGMTFRTAPEHLQSGREKAPGWFEHSRVKPENLEVLRTPDGNFEPVVPGSKVGEGPFTTAIGDTTSIPAADVSDPAKFNAAFDSFVAANKDELAKEGRYVGLFHDEGKGTIDFDVNVSVPTEREAEALQTALGRTGGAYDHWSTNGVFAPVNKGAWAEEHTQALAAKVQQKLDPAFVGPVEPDVERAIRQFSKWSKSTLAGGFAGGDQQLQALLAKVAGIPSEGGVPFNEMHQLLVNQVGHAMRQSAEDAFRLQYFARNRTFLERSINHPFFGIYPASYMWGKILPELARFMAQSPFGIRTGAAAYAFHDIQQAVATQRELDPNFEKKMDELGHSESAWFLGYLLPSLPWDVSSAAPTWARDLAQQGLDNQARVTSGQKPQPIDFQSPIKRVADYINPLRPLTQVEKPLAEIGNLVGGSPAEQKAHGGTKDFPIWGQFPDQKGPTPATGVGPLLSEEMQSLRDILAGQ